MRCEYLSVVERSLCPIISFTSFRSEPDRIRFEQNVCLRSWKWKPSIPAKERTCLQALSKRLIGTPFNLQKTYSSEVGLILFRFRIHSKCACQLRRACLVLGIRSSDNNAAENAIRPFVVGRKNWLFAGHPNGAEAGATFYSLVETAKANGLKPYNYLRYIFENISLAQTDQDYQNLLPQYVNRKAISPSAP